jgi:PAS domain S-box-containing protein
MPAQSPPAEPDPAALGDALQKSELRYRFLAETIPVQVWTARPNGMLDYVSSRAVNEFGIPMERLLLEGWQNVVHPDDLGGAVERWIRSLSSGDTYEVEFRLKMTDGTYAWYLARAVAQRGPDGAIVEWLGTNTNIDEQRETQRRMQALLDEVAAQARETESTLETLRSEKATLEARVAELEARVAASSRGADAKK